MDVKKTKIQRVENNIFHNIFLFVLFSVFDKVQKSVTCSIQGFSPHLAFEGRHYYFVMCFNFLLQFFLDVALPINTVVF